MRSFSHRMSFGGVVYSASIFESLNPTSCGGNFLPSKLRLFGGSLSGQTKPFFVLRLPPFQIWRRLLLGFQTQVKLRPLVEFTPHLLAPRTLANLLHILSQGKKTGNFHLRESGRIAFVRQMEWWIGVYVAMHTVEGFLNLVCVCMDCTQYLPPLHSTLKHL